MMILKVIKVNDNIIQVIRVSRNDDNNEVIINELSPFC